jgi:calcium-activated chloride channel regulator 4
MRRFAVILGAVVTAGTLSAAPALAGSGYLNTTTKKFDVSVSVRGNFTNAQLDVLKGRIQKASDLLGDVTDDQHRLGRVYVCNNSRGGRNADIWRVPGTASPRSSANVRGLGTAGMHMFLEDDIATSNANADGGHVIAHEFGHYAYGVYDEYCNNCTSAASTVAECLATNGPASLMENFWLRPISEFCVSTNHDPDGDTDQTRLNKKADNTPESAWETAKRYFPDLTVPATPVNAAPASQAIDWQVLKPETRLVIIIDYSGSMAGDRLTYAKAGAQLFVQLLRDDDKIGVIAFDDAVSTLFPLSTATPANKVAAQAAIGGLVEDGATAVWDALQAGVGLMNPSDPACQMIIILLTDGDDNSSAITQAAAAASARAAGIVVHAISLGSGADPGMVATANTTSGKFFQVNTPGQLAAVFATLQAESSTDGGIITKAQAPIQQGESVASDVKVENAGRTTFLVSWDDAADDLDLTVTAPDGSVLPRSSSPGIMFSEGPGYEFFLIDNAAAGTWKMAINAVSVGSTTNYALQAFGENSDASMAAMLDKPDGSYTYPEPIIVHAMPVTIRPIVGATVSMLVTRADGSQMEQMLYDDGDVDGHGDMQAEDGTYSARFTRFSGSGTYSFIVSANTAGAMLHSGEGLSDFPVSGSIGASGASNVPAASFERSTEVTAMVGGDPPTIVQLSPFTLDKARVLLKKAKQKKGRTIYRDTMVARGTFQALTGVDLASEDVEVTIGPFSKVIPAGSFKVRGKKRVARGPGYRLTFVLPAPTSGTTILGLTKFNLKVQKHDLSGFANPVPVSMLFQDDEGYLRKTFREKFKKGTRVRLVYP